MKIICIIFVAGSVTAREFSRTDSSVDVASDVARVSEAACQEWDS